MTQLEIQRKLTEWFISVGPPKTITLIPQVEIKEPGKGIKRGPGTPRAPQEFKIIWPGGDGFISSGQDGTQHRFDAIIVGLHDCEAEIGDIWEEGDQKYYIHSEYPDNQYERKFGLYSFGNKPSDA